MFPDKNIILKYTINLDWNLSFRWRFLVSPEYELNIFQDSAFAGLQHIFTTLTHQHRRKLKNQEVQVMCTNIHWN